MARGGEFVVATDVRLSRPSCSSLDRDKVSSAEAFNLHVQIATWMSDGSVPLLRLEIYANRSKQTAL